LTPVFYIFVIPAGSSLEPDADSLAFDRSSDLEKIRKVLEMKMVGEKLKEFGFTTHEIEKR
jgi:hypothetical protein